MSDKCEICGFYHKWNEPCREDESHLPYDGYIAFRDGLYIKPLSNESWNKRMAEINDNKKVNIPKQRNSIRNRLTRLKDRIAEAGDEHSYGIVKTIGKRFGKGGKGLTEDEINTLNEIGEKYPGI